jgi:hypothetical protein
MTTLFMDLWHDLREKRLWPVAVGLLAAIVAVPVILFKPASPPSVPPVATPNTGAGATLPVVSVDTGPIVGSRLETFKQKNPFKPMKDLVKQPATASTPATAGTSGSSSGGSTSSGSSSSKSSGGGTSTGGTSTTPSSPPSVTPTAPSVQWFHYTADFSFGQPGHTTKFTSAASFVLLPDDQHPSIVFLGIGGDHKSALFFISDPLFNAAGEGKCNPRGAACRFVTLKVSETGNEETFTSVDGSVTYNLKLLRIKRETLPTDSKGNPKPAQGKAGKGLAATGAGVAMTTQTSFGVLPGLFADGPGVARQQK